MAYLLHDAAGRLVKEGNKSYTYAWLDKLVSVTEAGKVSANFDYHPDGQIASVTYADGRRENYLWDGLALIHRNGTDILNEPAITGGNPVLSGDKVLFNDLLGNTLGVKDQSSYQPIRMTAFGESDNADAFFTGKPLVGELGYTFLFRNYRPEQGKWQTADPLGYPDGWNNLAYCNNNLISCFDWQGGKTASIYIQDVARCWLKGYSPSSFSANVTGKIDAKASYTEINPSVNDIALVFGGWSGVTSTQFSVNKLGTGGDVTATYQGCTKNLTQNLILVNTDEKKNNDGTTTLTKTYHAILNITLSVPEVGDFTVMKKKTFRISKTYE